MVWNANQRRAAREVLIREVSYYENMFNQDASTEEVVYMLTMFSGVMNFATRLGLISESERQQYMTSSSVLAGIAI